jgi:hypothetical protein
MTSANTLPVIKITSYEQSKCPNITNHHITKSKPNHSGPNPMLRKN